MGTLYHILAGYLDALECTQSKEVTSQIFVLGLISSANLTTVVFLSTNFEQITTLSCFYSVQ